MISETIHSLILQTNIEFLQLRDTLAKLRDALNAAHVTTSITQWSDMMETYRQELLTFNAQAKMNYPSDTL